MAARDPAERALRARIAASSRWARCPDRAAATAPARRAVEDRFVKVVDPDGVLPPAELAKRVASAKSEYYSRLALSAKLARRGGGVRR